MSIRFNRATGDFEFDLPPSIDSFLEREKKYLQQILLMIVTVVVFLKYGVR